jgi:pimeloyl-ACP methyl ester carboxylesterase
MKDSAYSTNEIAEKSTLGVRIFKLAKRLLKSCAFIYCGVLIGLLLMENYLVYPGSKYPRGNWEPDFEFEDVEFKSKDGVNIHAWLMHDNFERETPRYFLLCHGNGENVAQSGGYIGQYLRHECSGNVMVFDYRGFGKSEGSSHEAGIKLDADKALEVCCEKFGIQPSEVILVGHSLGGAVATYLASTYGCKALILQRTFSSLPDVAQSKYPWAPVRYLMRNRFDSETAIESYDGPVFQSHGDIDRIVPFEFGKKIAAKLTHPMSKFVTLENYGHNDGFPNNYWTIVNDWISEVESADEEGMLDASLSTDGEGAAN